NALVAVAVGLEFGVSLQEIKTALAHVKLPGKRMEVFKRDKILVLNDSYNANPDSTLAALEIVKQTTSPGKKIFVFGDMLELGDLAPAEHARIGKSLKNFGVDIFLAFGPQSAEAVRQAQNTSKNMIAKHFTDKNELISELKKNIKEHDLLLVKGSRGMKMEDVIEGLFQEIES
ncbi:MAG: glutamate ligase domain-containing protein, partial [bacterium]